MTTITFTRDVLSDAGTILYNLGYQADVSQRTAHKWVSSGDAVFGAIEVVAKPAKRRSEARAAALAAVSEAEVTPPAEPAAE